MKTRLCQKSPFAPSPRNEQGMAVIVVVALFAIMLLFLGSSLHSVNYLRQDLRLIEREQLQRIHRTYGVTNAVAATNTLTSLELRSQSIIII